MDWTTIKRRAAILAGGSTLLLAACGGGEKHPAGPDGEWDTYDLVALGRAGVPTDAEVEDCILTRFYSGGLRVDADGNWQLALQVHDDNYGDWGYRDEGHIDEDEDGVWFDSEITDVSFQGIVNGGELTIVYDWCENGVPDVQLVFE